MTIIIGARCQDGAIIGADSAATFAAGTVLTIEQLTNKIQIIDDKLILACTGPVGLHQRFAEVVHDGWNKKVFKKTPTHIGKILCANGINDFKETGAKYENQFGALLAFPSNNEAHVCEFSLGDFQPELKLGSLWWVSMGSGQRIVDPFLGFLKSIFWNDNSLPKYQNALLAIVWALHHAIDVNPGGIKDPIRIAVLTKGTDNKLTASELEEDEINDHIENMEGAKEALREYAKTISGKNVSGAVDLPDP